MRNLWKILFLLFIINRVVILEKQGEREIRSPIQPCLSCTTLNKAQCCQKYNKCCGDSSQGTQNRNVNQQVPKLVPQQQRVVSSKTPTTQKIASVKVRYHPVGRQAVISLGTCPANRNVYGMLRQQQCTVCNPDGFCSDPNTRCCPPPVRCCRRLDFNGLCPLTVISSRCCRRCSSDGTCRLGEGCCAQPGHQGCCVTNCNSNMRNCPNFSSRQPIPSSDPETITVHTSIPATELPGRTTTVTQTVTQPPPATQTPEVVIMEFEDENGNVQEIEVTITVINGITVTVTQNGEGGYDTIQDVVEEEEDVITETQIQTITEIGEAVVVIETVIDGETYTATSIGNNGYVITITKIINNTENLYVTTVYDQHTEEVVVTNTLPPVTITENAFFTEVQAVNDGFNNKLQPSFTDEFV